MVIERIVAEDVAIQVVLGEQTEPTCCHHWVIEAANGPISWGVCQICHEGKEFQNSISNMGRDY